MESLARWTFDNSLDDWLANPSFHARRTIDSIMVGNRLMTCEAIGHCVIRLGK